MIKYITFITVNYAPEDTAIGLYTSQVAEFLATKGYSVSVITGFPYYPMWEIPTDYKNKPNYFIEDIKGVKIYRYKFFVPKNKNFFNRVLHILSFNIGNIFNIRMIKKADLVFCNIPFTTNVMLGLYLKRKLNAKLWTSIQDFEFDAAYESGLVKSNFISSLFKSFLYKIENYLFSKSDIISSISYNMVEKIKQKAPKTNPILFPNWVDVDFINPESSKQHKYISKEHFTVLYSGNIGKKQDWEIYIALAKKLSQHTDIEFILVGEGAYKNELLDMLRKEKLNNFIQHHDTIPYEDLSDLLCSADLHVLFQKTDVIDSVMPSKILGMMSSSKPSIITGNKESEVAKHINLSQEWGFYANNEIEKIYNDILWLKNNKNLQHQIGMKARNYVVNNFSKDKILNSFLNKIDSL